MPVGIHIHAELENQELEQTKYKGVPILAA